MRMWWRLNGEEPDIFYGFKAAGSMVRWEKELRLEGVACVGMLDCKTWPPF